MPCFLINNLCGAEICSVAGPAKESKSFCTPAVPGTTEGLHYAVRAVLSGAYAVRAVLSEAWSAWLPSHGGLQPFAVIATAQRLPSYANRGRLVVPVPAAVRDIDYVIKCGLPSHGFRKRVPDAALGRRTEFSFRVYGDTE